MKIALLTPTFSSFSGIDRIVQQKELELSAKNDVTIFALSADIKPKKAKLVVLGMPKSPFWQRVYRLFFFLDNKKVDRTVDMLKDFDVAISFFYPMNIIACNAKKKYKVKYVYHNAGVAYPSLFSFTERVYLNMFNTFTNNSIMIADEVVSISKFLADELEKETGIKSKVEYVKIDTKRFNSKVPKSESDKVKKKFNLKGKTILYVGRLSPHKGIHLLIKSFNLVRKQIPGANLLIVGKHTFGGYSKELKRMAGPGVIFAGYVPDEELAGYYAASNVYATASLWEGFDIPIVEANACGKPIVAFDVGSHKEVTKKGVLVQAGNVEKFAEEIVKLLK